MPARFVYIWFPELKTDWLIRRRPELKDACFVLTIKQHGRMVISAVSPAARAQAIRTGMVLADARTIVPDILSFDDHPGRFSKLLEKLAEWFVRFSPVVATDGTDGLILNSDGCSHLWGGEENYLRIILEKIRSMGYHCRGAIAGTIGAAWAIVHYTDNAAILTAHTQLEHLLSLPPEALRLEPDTAQRLNKLGLRQIGQFIQIPPRVLRRRFGPHLLTRIRQALGTEDEPLHSIIPVPPYEERLPCIEPLITGTAIEIAISQLLKMICSRLRTEGLGVRSATLTCYRIDGKKLSVTIGTSRSSSSEAHLFRLFSLKIPTIDPGLGIELFSMEANKTEPVRLAQEKLWNLKAELQDEGLAELLDRLTGKTSTISIRRYLPQEHYWPERSVRTAEELEESCNTTWRTDKSRPVRIFAKPEPIEVSAPIPDYPPMNFRYKNKLHPVVKADGPERIEREWWLEDGEHRDYYTVEDHQGHRYWLFRSGHYDEEGSQWFIHGLFA
ncbi:DNA polymerase Y family protein [Pedobacter sp. JY14-1]|uniref:Y-family DNA polymerase n=1 Tax=Pedobacter sp. JY14-1 TaxID=3034151 RepID=UPI0023E2D583|nr:DNA polymerase Y family protein [Pedobacter sp. JY14-1]